VYESTLILVAAGGSRLKVEDALREYSATCIWTLNATRHELEELQFEIHAPEPRNKINCGRPAIVSPFFAPTVSRPEKGAPRIPFPLDAACDLGAPFFELSHDYMLAYAALIHTGRLPEAARVPGVSVRPFRRIVLCGVDMNDRHHFARSRAAHFWIGLLRGLGVEIVPAGESTLLAGGVLVDAVIATGLRRPFFYGQPVAAGGNC